MAKALEYLTIKFCEILPFDWTTFEENGFCQKPSENCKYCEKIKKEKSFCSKKTYSHISSLKLV